METVPPKRLKPETAAKRQAAKAQELAFLRDEIEFLERAIQDPKYGSQFFFTTRDIPKRLQQRRTRLAYLEVYCGLRASSTPVPQPPPLPAPHPPIAAEQLYLLRELARLLKPQP